MSYVGMEAAVNHRFSGSAAGMGMCFWMDGATVIVQVYAAKEALGTYLNSKIHQTKTSGVMLVMFCNVCNVSNASLVLIWLNLYPNLNTLTGI